ncbi:TetR family transcriptional regulator [Amycolatopsis antarctica]|uniref:TetR family transcriptional regulator n=1 Tax=Amycolatopsis antarctica TaxID=1854586 RepID=A0A263CVZ1_9PSEU|nr:helix-turn-helix domain-containing protein [Amycolatopsis antarctica]OZM70128.1 TetR family transcriptional regulator [Amycolatopsis antarctica]
MTPSGSGPAPHSRGAAGLPALTRDRIIAAATLLTAERGLDNWSVRQLAAEVHAYPAVIYHHVGDRDAVIAAVTDRVLRMVSEPPPELGWREWFELLLARLREVLLGYPGVAGRLALFGPADGSAVRMIDTGVRVLRGAGFGQESVLVYNMLLSSGCQYVAMERDRLRGLEQRVRAAGCVRPAEGPDPGAHELLRDPERASTHYARLYEYAIARCLDGAACRLAELTAS